MNFILLISLIILYICESRNFTLKDEDMELDLVQVIFRHGERTPDKKEMLYLNHLEETDFHPYELGQLTNTGKMKEYNLGKWLRKRYDKFLGETYSSKDVYAYASDYDRTKESLELVLASLYPPNDQLNWNHNLSWIPIAYHSLPKKLDMLMHSYYCAENIILEEKYQDSNEMKNFLIKYKNIRQIFQNFYGTSIGITELTDIYNAIKIQKNFNLTLPIWYTDDVFNELKEAAKDSYKIITYSKDLTKYHGGPLVRRFIENMNLSFDNKIKRKIYLYSSHGWNIKSVLDAHNAKSPEDLIDYGAAFILEKFKDKNNQIYVKVLFWTGVTGKLVNLNICSTEDPCPLSNYMELVNSIIPADEDMRCLLRNVNENYLEDILISDTAFKMSKN